MQINKITGLVKIEVSALINVKVNVIVAINTAMVLLALSAGTWQTYT